MKKPYMKKAVQNARKAEGHFKTGSRIPLKKEADLASFYYPGIEEVLEKVAGNPKQLEKLSSFNRTVAVITTKGPEHYPLLSAKAALLSEVAGVNALPIMIKYDKVNQIGSVIASLAHNFQMILCTELSPLERAMAESTYSGDTPVVFHDQLQAGAVVASVMAHGKILKKSPKTISVILEGSNALAHDILHLLMKEKYANITLLDERGPLFMKRPNMNRYKKALVSLVKTKKDQRSRAEAMAETDVYINTECEELKSSESSRMGEKSLLITTRAQVIEKSKKQSIASTMPLFENHISDLHLAAGLAEALCEQKKWSDKSLTQAISGLATVYKTPKPARMIPGLLEKNMAKKIAKSIK